VGENQSREVAEHIQLVDHRRELAQKLQRLNQRCLRQRKQSSKEQRQVVKEFHINTKERSNG